MAHPNALLSIKQKISDIVNNCIIKDGWPVIDSISLYLIKFSKEVSKHYDQWLTEPASWSIIYDYIIQSLKKKHPDPNAERAFVQAIIESDPTKKLSGSLIDILGNESITALVNSISDLIVSIPRQYNVYFPLPSVPSRYAKHIQLSDDISFCKFDETNPPPLSKRGLIDKLALLRAGIKTELEVNISYVAIRTNGYIRHSVDEITFIESLSKFKQIMHMGIILQLFQKNFINPSQLSYMPREDSNAMIVDMENPRDISAVIALPDNIVSFIKNIALGADSIKDLSTLKDESAIIDYFKNKLAIPIKLISAPDENTDAQSIKTAIEWAFDSSVEENETVSFIQACIGIEAILGEETGRDSLTETLADRCAYLLATNIGNRKKLRNYFRKLYRLRSKIVHGRAIRLSSKESEYMEWGKSVLNSIIRKEIGLLKL